MSFDPKPILALFEAHAKDYEIDKEVGDKGLIGQGGMATVFAVRHRELGARMAVKVMNAPDGQVAQRFRNEARVAARAQSHHIARVYHLAALESNRYYMVMEYLVGSDLEQYLKQRGTISASEAIDYVLQACEGLATAHALGIIHRDVKPANLIRSQRPDGVIEIKVLDFGLAKVSAELDRMENPGTAVVSLMGSPSYMSPEQARSTKNVDERTDIWSLGIILFELVSGRLPFPGQGLEQLTNILNQPPQVLDSAALHLPAGLCEIVTRCLAKDLSRRYCNLAELSADLALIGGLEGRESARRIATLLGRESDPNRSTMIGSQSATLASGQEPQRSADASPEKNMASSSPAPRKSGRKPSRRKSLLVAGIAVAALVAIAMVVKTRWFPHERSQGAGERLPAPPASKAAKPATPRPRVSPNNEDPRGLESTSSIAAHTAPSPASEATREALPGSTVDHSKVKAGITKSTIAPGKKIKKSSAPVKKKGTKRR